MTILVTGGAGFIGSHLCERLLSLGHDLAVVDNFNDFYDPAVKRRNFGEVEETARRLGRNLHLCEGDIRDIPFLDRVCRDASAEAVLR